MASSDDHHPTATFNHHFLHHSDFDDPNSNPNTFIDDPPSSSDTADDNTTTNNHPSTSAVTLAIPANQKPQPPIDDSRRLFQRLWTDEDEIQLLQGFLHFTSSRPPGYHHHHDTAPFYDQIKSKLQLDFNKNQLIEKLRRLKKKYRNVLAKMNSGKEFSFKNPHDQAIFEISKKIWSNLSVSHRGAVEFDDDDQNPTPIPTPNNNNNNINNTSIVPPPPPPNSGGYYISHINLNNAATPVGDHQKSNFGAMVPSFSNSPAGKLKLSTRKRPRVDKLEDKYVRVNLGEGGNDGINVNPNATATATATADANNAVSSNSNNNISNMNNNVHVGPTMQGLIEETVKNSLSPMFKEMINNGVKRGGSNLGGNGIGIKGVGALALNAIPLNFPGVNFGNSGHAMDEKWRKQQILELEVYSKRLELVQDQIKLALVELKSRGV